MARIATTLSLEVQDYHFMRKERWLELDVLNLPSGELEFFERKSGALFSDEGNLRRTLGKALSAFANSGGGHIVLGVDDGGLIDGVPISYKGRQRTREWLERVIPNLVAAPLQDFSVHEAEPGVPTQIPTDASLIVIDVGDSMLAPHQDVETKHYFHRVGGNSVPAAHHILELLRDRERYPTQKVAHAWLNFVISRFLSRLNIERTRLNSQQLHWESATKSFVGIASFHINAGALSANQMQFLESYPEIKQKIELHDENFRELSYQVSNLARTIESNDAFKSAYLLSISGDSLQRIRPSGPDEVIFDQDKQMLSSLFSSRSEAERLALLTQHVINKESDLTKDKMPCSLWNMFRREFMAVLEEPDVCERDQLVHSCQGAFLNTVEALITMLENTRRELAQRYGEVWEDETLRNISPQSPWSTST